MRSMKYVPLLLAVAVFTLNGCTSMLLVKSAWDEKQIVVDGKDNDWGDTMFYIPDAQLTAGIRNDSKYMYVILKATNRQQSFQILGLGMTVWFDPSGGSHKTFGIHFPLGRMQEGMPMRSFQDSNNVNQGFAMRTPNELQLLGVNPNGPVPVSIADLKGIQLQIHTDRDGLIYEMRVPLHSSPGEPYAINATGPNIGIGFVGGKFEMQERRREGGFDRGGQGGGMPGGLPGGEGGEGGGMGRDRGERGSYERPAERQRPKQIDFWLKVNLASGSQPTDVQ